jgi:hypothetical protein
MQLDEMLRAKKCLNYKMDAAEIGWGGVGWIELAQVRDWWRALMDIVMNLWVP